MNKRKSKKQFKLFCKKWNSAYKGWNMAISRVTTSLNQLGKSACSLLEHIHQQFAPTVRWHLLNLKVKRKNYYLEEVNVKTNI